MKKLLFRRPGKGEMIERKRQKGRIKPNVYLAKKNGRAADVKKAKLKSL